MSINEVRYLPECGSTNAYVKEHFEEFGPVAAVYTENQTAGRAFQSAFVVHRFQLSPAYGTGEQGKQFGIQSHEASPWRSVDV